MEPRNPLADKLLVAAAQTWAAAQEMSESISNAPVDAIHAARQYAVSLTRLALDGMESQRKSQQQQVDTPGVWADYVTRNVDRLRTAADIYAGADFNSDEEKINVIEKLLRDVEAALETHQCLLHRREHLRLGRYAEIHSSDSVSSPE